MLRIIRDYVAAVLLGLLLVQLLPVRTVLAEPETPVPTVTPAAGETILPAVI